MPIQLPSKPPKKQSNLARISKQASFWVFVLLVPVAIIQFSSKAADQAPIISYSQYDAELQRGNIEKVTIQAGNKIEGDFKNNVMINRHPVSKFNVRLPIDNSSDDLKRLREAGVQISAEDARLSFAAILVTVLPYALMMAVVFLIFRSLQAGGAKAFSFVKSKAKLLTGDTPKVTFDDVAGADEAKVDLQEIIEFLRIRRNSRNSAVDCP